MTTPLLLCAYAAAGLVFGCLVFLRSQRRDLGTAASVAVTVAVWPIWLPFALARPAPPPRGPLAARVAAALAAEHSSGSDDGWLEPRAAQRLLGEVERAEGRLSEIEARLGAAKRAVAQADPPVTEEGRARAAIRSATIEQLERLQRREHRALSDLAEVCELLRAQSALAGFGISDRAEELRDELWARVQALSELSTTPGQSFVVRGPDHCAISSTRM